MPEPIIQPVPEQPKEEPLPEQDFREDQIEQLEEIEEIALPEQPVLVLKTDNLWEDKEEVAPTPAIDPTPQEDNLITGETQLKDPKMVDQVSIPASSNLPETEHGHPDTHGVDSGLDIEVYGSQGSYYMQPANQIAVAIENKPKTRSARNVSSDGSVRGRSHSKGKRKTIALGKKKDEPHTEYMPKMVSRQSIC